MAVQEPFTKGIFSRKTIFPEQRQGCLVVGIDYRIELVQMDYMKGIVAQFL